MFEQNLVDISFACFDFCVLPLLDEPSLLYQKPLPKTFSPLFCYKPEKVPNVPRICFEIAKTILSLKYDQHMRTFRNRMENTLESSRLKELLSLFRKHNLCAHTGITDLLINRLECLRDQTKGVESIPSEIIGVLYLVYV